MNKITKLPYKRKMFGTYAWSGYFQKTKRKRRKISWTLLVAAKGLLSDVGPREMGAIRHGGN